MCEAIQRSSVSPFEVNIREKLLILKKYMPDWKEVDIMLQDSEAFQQLVGIVKLQDQWIKSRASNLYIDPLLLELKIRLLTREDLADSFVRCWHPVAQVDQLTARGLEKAFVYWRELVPMSERFKEQFGNFAVAPGQMDFEELKSLNIFSKEEFETRLGSIRAELVQAAGDGEVDYRKFVRGPTFEETAVRAYLTAFVVTEGRATIRIDPLTEEIFLSPREGGPASETKSVAIEIA
jgi:hypothetical protein